jgi:acetyltransferase-like isoleucine patch superfamily enzyme
MQSRIEQVLKRHLHGRDIAVWGNPTRLMLRTLRQYKLDVAEKVDPEKHYVVAVNDEDLSDFLQDEQSKLFHYVDDFLTFNDPGGELPFEWDCFGVKIGRQTYFGDGVAQACKEGYVERIGHFTSINCSVDIAVNHQLNMTTVSDDIQQFLTNENMALFQNKLLSDPNHPYAYGKKSMTIGNDVYIGAYAFINASKVTKIGDGAIIGSGAVVLEDVPPYAVVVGVPAKVKRYRYDTEMIETLLRVKWWEWSIEEINANADALMSPEIFLERFRVSSFLSMGSGTMNKV